MLRPGLQQSRILRVQQLAFLVQNKEMRVSLDLRVLAQKRFILILWAEIHLHDHVLFLQYLRGFGICGEELIQLVAPSAPLASDIQQDSLVVLLGNFNRRFEILLRISLRVEFDSERFLLRLLSNSITW